MIPDIAGIPKFKSDLLEIEALVAIARELDVMDTMADIFDRLFMVAGTRDFLPLFSCLNMYISRIKWIRMGYFGLGYIVPWPVLYANMPYLDPKLTQTASRLLDKKESRTNIEAFSEDLAYGMGEYPQRISVPEVKRLSAGLKSAVRIPRFKRVEKKARVDLKFKITKEISELENEFFEFNPAFHVPPVAL
jgi:hypothetical protein